RPGAARQRRPDQGHREGQGAGPARPAAGSRGERADRRLGHQPGPRAQWRRSRRRPGCPRDQLPRPARLMSTPVQPGRGEDEPQPAAPGRRGYTASTRSSADSARRFAAAAEQAAARWPLSRITGAGVLVMALFSMLAIAIAGTALASQASARNRLETIIDPASGSGRTKDYDLAPLETGIRNNLLSGTS